MEPVLDRFSRPRRWGVKVLLLPPECDVCGQEAHPKFLQKWNGKDVCKYCINDINEEAEKYAIFDHNHRRG